MKACCWTSIFLLFLVSFIHAADLTPPSADDVEAIKKIGGNVMPVAANDPHLDVTLYLASQDVTDETLKHVARLPQTVWLNLAGTKITDEGLSQLQSLKALERLHLEKTQIGDAGLAALAPLENLVYLNLYGTKVTDAGLKHLAAHKKLRHLYLWKTAVTPEGIAELQKQLPELKIDSGGVLNSPPPPKPESPDAKPPAVAAQKADDQNAAQPDKKPAEAATDGDKPKEPVKP